MITELFTIDAYYIFLVDCLVHVMEILNDIPTKKAKRLTSVVWNHFERVRKADAQYAVCLHCKKKLSGSSNSGTTHLRNHLLRCLKRSNYDVSQILAAKRKRKESSQSPLHQTNVGLTSIAYEEAKMKDEILSPIPIKYYSEQKSDEFYHSINLGSIKFDQDRSRLDLARMIMLHGYPLDMVDHYGFKIFVNNLQPLFELNSSGVIELDCMAIYGKEKQKVYESLYHFHGRISLAVDMWGSPEGYDYEYIGLTANYIDDAWKLQKKMLNFISLDPSSTDDMISEAIIKSSIDWAIDGKLCSMTFDDCSSHEVMVFKVKDWLSQNRPLLKSGELFDVRCIIHLLKSIAQEVIESFRDVTHKIRESVRHVKSTQQLVMKFNELADQVVIDSRHLVLDHPMHWNSTYSMLESAVANKAAFHLLRQHDPSYSKALSETEWEQASAIAGYMKFLLEFTNIVIQNKNPTANIFFQEICDMHIQLNEWCKSHDDFLSSVALRMKIKFDVYWSKCSLVLAITAILDPRFKMKLVEYYFRQIYGAAAAHNRIKEVSNGLRELFNEYFVGSSSLNQDHGSSLSSNVSKDKLKGFDKFLHETCENQSMTSDLEKYLEEPVFPRNYDFNILNWWKVHMPRYPILSMMARDFLSIPVSTIGPDIAFSNCGRVVDKYHMSLSPESREAFICGQDWLKIEPKGL